jgi:hypothetical protein
MRSSSVRRTVVRRAAAFTAIALAVPLAGCAAVVGGDGATAIDLARAGCPADIRVQTDDRPGVEWGFLYSLLDPEDVDILNAGTAVRSPLTVDGEPTGVTLTILTGDPLDGVSANVDLYDHENLLLAAVDTDRAILDAVRLPTVGLFSPTLRDSRMFYWDSEVYKNVRSIEGLGDTLDPTGEALVPIVAAPNDPFTDFMVGDRALGPEQVLPEYDGDIQSFIKAGGVRAQQGDVLVDPYLLAQPDSGLTHDYGSQLVNDAGYLRDTLLSARPQTVVRYADCFEVFIPLLQQALAAFADDPDATTELLVELAPKLGHPEFDAGLAAYGLATMKKERIVGNGRDDAIGDIDMGHLHELLDDAVPAWQEVDISVPGDIDTGDIATNRFIDRSIGL